MVQVIQVQQNDIRTCKFCGAKIAWLKNKAGKSYPVNVDYAVDHEAATFKTNFHRCNREAQ